MNGAPPAENCSTVDCTAISLQDWCVGHGEPFVEFAAWDDPLPRLGADAAMVSERPRMFGGRVSDAWSLPPQGYLCTPDRHLIYRGLGARDYLPMADLGGRCLASDGATRFRISFAEEGPAVDQECVYLGGAKNFGHFVFQYLLRLVGLNWLPATRELPLAVYDGLPARYLEFLDLLGYPASRRIVISPDTATRFAKLWLVSSPIFRRGGGKAQVWPEAVWGLRQAVAGFAKPLHAGRSRIYVPRGNAAWRRLVNERSIVEALQAQGFQSVELENMPAVEQIRILSNAEIVVAVGGAASVITLFAPSDCAVIELTPPEIVGSFGSVAFSDVLGQPFARVVGRALSAEESVAAGLPAPLSTNVIDKDFQIDAETLQALVLAADRHCRRVAPQ